MEKFREIPKFETEINPEQVLIEIPNEDIEQGKVALQRENPEFLVQANDTATAIAEKRGNRGSQRFKIIRQLALGLLLSNFAPACRAPSVEQIKDSHAKIEQEKESVQTEKKEIPQYTAQQIAELVKTSDKELDFISAPGQNVYYQIAEGDLTTVRVNLTRTLKVQELLNSTPEIINSHIHPIKAASYSLGISHELPKENLGLYYAPPSPLDLSSLAMRKFDLFSKETAEIKERVFDYNGTWEVSMNGGNEELVKIWFTTITINPENDEIWTDLKKYFHKKEEIEELNHLKKMLVFESSTGKGPKDIRSFREDWVKGSLRSLYVNRLSKYDRLCVDVSKLAFQGASKNEIQNKIRALKDEAKKQGFEIKFVPYE